MGALPIIDELAMITILTSRRNLDYASQAPLHPGYTACHHQDPDITGALPVIDELVSHDDTVLVNGF